MVKKQKILWLAFTAVLFVLRCYQLLTLTEPETGFLRSFDWSGYVFYILLAGSAVLFALAGLKADPTVYPRAASTRTLRGGMLIVLAVSVLIESVLSALTHNASMYKTIWLILGIVGVVAGICLILMGIGLFQSGKLRLPAALMLTVSLWLALRALLYYLETPYAVTVPSLLLFIVSNLLLSVWWTEELRVLGGVAPEQGQKLLNALTPVCLTLILATGLPALVLDPTQPGMTLQHLVTVVFLPYIILSTLREKTVETVSD